MVDRIRKALDGFYGFMGHPLYLWTRPVLVALVIPLVIAAVLPLWRISLEAPQYPEGLTVDIYTYTLKSGHDDTDLHEINILNHYVGMKKIERAAFAELDWLPFAFGAVAVLALRVAAIGNVRMLIDLAVITGYFTLFSAGRFVYKMYVYGHDLSPEAPVKVPPFMPAVLGTKQVGNFTTHAAPAVGTYLVGIFALGVAALTLFHLIRGRAESKRARLAGSTSSGAPPVGLHPENA